MSVGPDRINMEVNKARCTTCGWTGHILLHPLVQLVENAVPVKRCQAPRCPSRTSVVPYEPSDFCGGLLVVESARGIAHRVISVGAPWFNVAEPVTTEFLGARPGYVWAERERQRRGRWRG